MNRDELTAAFDGQAESYDAQWSELAPINDALHLLTSSVLAELPPTAHVLCVGAGTGVEILYLAERFPEWRFTAVEPSVPMLDVLRRKADELGITSRCVLHAGYLESLPPSDPFDAATAFLVSQFILDRHLRSAFFQEIAERLTDGGLLVTSDLAGELSTDACQDLLGVWFQVMSRGGVSHERLNGMREAYERHVAILPPHDVESILEDGGFGRQVRFFQAGMIHAWYARRPELQDPPEKRS